MISEASDLTAVLGDVDDILINLAQNITYNVSTTSGNVEINAFLTNQTMFNRNELNANNSSSNTVIDSLEIPVSNKNSSFAVVVAKLTSHQLHLRNQEVDENGISETLLGIPGSSFLSINVFDRANKAEISSRISYTKALTADVSPSVNEVFGFQYNLATRKVVNNLAYACHFFNASAVTYSTAGCSGRDSIENNNGMSCSCDHTTVFAVLLSVKSFEIPVEVRVRFDNDYLICFIIQCIYSMLQRLH